MNQNKKAGNEVLCSQMPQKSVQTNTSIHQTCRIQKQHTKICNIFYTNNKFTEMKTRNPYFS
jgi:hypothetical protein